MKICTKCVLPETFPGIKFDEQDICQFCLHHKPEQNHEKLKQRYEQKFFDLLAKVKSKGPYDILLAYSGGKDSTYTLKLIKAELHLRALAITFNNGFISDNALINIKRVTEALNVDHLMVSPGLALLSNAFRQSAEKDIYPLKYLERASSVCNTCMNLVKSFMLKTAVEMDVPLIGYGWSPGQAPVQSSVMRWNPSMIEQMQHTVRNILAGIMGDDLRPFVMQDRHFKLLSEGDVQFYNVHPLAFFDYDENMILDTIKKFGWQEPKDTDANSTNCLLNSFGIAQHEEKLGFHPYAHEIAGLVRNGYMTRAEGLAKLSVPLDENILQHVKKKLQST